jgi:superfamily I DNA/RNA helicase
VEQHMALAAFSTGEDMVITAGAGTGKTSTLRLLAASTTRGGIYVAFNKSIAEEARRSFPASVTARTAHSFAWQWARDNPHAAAVLGRIQKRVHWTSRPTRSTSSPCGCPPSTSPGHTFQRATVTRWFLDMVRLFCQSDAQVLGVEHMPKVPGLSEEVRDEVVGTLLPKALAAWAELVNPSGSFCQVGHDTYLKLWQLAKPVLPGEYLLFDEAQDASRSSPP